MGVNVSMVTLLDYGEGNIASVAKAFSQLGQSVTITSAHRDVEKAEILVVPGQGAFRPAMTQLKKQDCIGAITDHVAQNKPFLGICLGFQILFDYSEEHGGCEGLGLFPGHFKAFDKNRVKSPQMGWNALTVSQNTPFFLGIPEHSYVYFVHSYYLEQTHASLVASTTAYQTQYVSSIQKGHLFATQFHPEKSGELGLQLLANFLAQSTPS